MTPQKPPPDSTPSKSPARSIVAIVVVLALGAGLAWAGSYGGAKAGGIPVFALVVGLAFVIQLVAFVPAWLGQTEHFFDLVGSATYVLAVVVAVVVSDHTDALALLLAALVVVWAARLGPFLFRRVRRAGSDERFAEIKPRFWRFLTVWVVQGLWVSMTVGAALAGITAAERPGIGVLTIVGVAVWLVGFALEVVADAQKSRFRADPATKGDFIRSGLWAWSRHPNYLGEIVLWLGVALAALPALDGWRYATLVSPVFVFLLLTRVSGVPLLEKRADERWGGQADYEAYKASTPVLLPRPPRSAA